MSVLIDLIFPKEDGLTAARIAERETRERDAVLQVETASNPKTYGQAYEQLIETETERLRSVEGRLGSALGLTSITATLLISGILALLNGTLADSSKFARGVAGAAAVYLSLQIICCTLAAVRGLRRATWLRSGIDDLIDVGNEGPVSLARKHAVSACKRYQATDQTINYKVTQMAIAHTAIRNFAAASVVIAVIGFVAVLVQPSGGAMAKAIKKDPELQKLLRGPQGLPGPPGPVGPAATNAFTNFNEASDAPKLPAPRQSNKR